MLVGRLPEQRRIEELLTLGRAGTSGTLLLVGDPGIGKTALLEHAAAEADGFRIVGACGVQSEAELSFAGLFDVCRPLLSSLERLEPLQADALRAAFGAGEGAAPTGFAVAAATLSLLAAAAEMQPLLVLVDDAHWLDRSSASALAFAARRLRADTIAFLFALRPGEGGALEGAGLPTLVVEGLDDDSASQLLEQTGGGSLPRKARDELLALAGGNPLALLELPHQPQAPVGDAGPPRLGIRLEQAFAARAATLPASAGQALLLAAAIGNAELEPVDRALHQLELDSTDLEPAESARLVSLEQGVLRFRHPLVRSAVYHAADPAERRRVHAAVARALGDDDRAAWHLAAAALTTDERAARALEQAARAALHRSGFPAAAAAYEGAARLSESSSERVRRLAAAADAAWLAGETNHALALIEQALTDTDEPQRRGELLHLRGTIEHFVGEARHAQRTLEQAAALLATVDPQQACLSLTEAVGSALLVGEAGQAVMLGRQALEIADAQHLEQRLFAWVPAGASLLLAGQPEKGLPLLQRAADTLDDTANRDPRNLTWAALAGLFIGDERLMVANAAGAAEWARAHAAPAALPWADMLLGVGLIIAGRWREARVALLEGVGAARLTAQDGHLVMALGPLAWLDAAQGNEHDCRSRVEEGLAFAERLELVWFRKWLHHALVMLELGAGAGGRTPSIDALHRDLVEQPLRDPPTPPLASWPDLIEALLRLDELAAADQLLQRHADEVQRLAKPLPRALIERLGGLRTPEGSEQRFERALSLHADCGNTFEEARTRLAYGQRLRRSGQRIAAREQLQAALAVFEHLPAAPWAERARVELRASGQRLRARHQSSRDELTPQELQIALAVAEGKTNREVGAQLFLSPKTVEWHLGHIYRKLDVRSRTELARAMPERPLPDPAE